MKTNYEDVLRSKTDEEIEFLLNRMVGEEVTQCIEDEAELGDFTRNCCKFVDKIARIPVLGKIAVNINILCNMLVDSEYPKSMATKCIIIAVLSYLILPVDFIPDAIPLTGMLDDIHVLNWAFEKLAGEVAQYKNYLYMKNKVEFWNAMNTVVTERSFQVQNEKTDNKVTFMKEEVA